MARQSAPARCQGQRQLMRPISQEESIMLNNPVSSTWSKSAQMQLKRALSCTHGRLKSDWSPCDTEAPGVWGSHRHGKISLGARCTHKAGLSGDVCYASFFFFRDLKQEESREAPCFLETHVLPTQRGCLITNPASKPPPHHQSTFQLLDAVCALVRAHHTDTHKEYVPTQSSWLYRCWKQRQIYHGEDLGINTWRVLIQVPKTLPSFGSGHSALPCLSFPLAGQELDSARDAVRITLGELGHTLVSR